jgi:hypothetical protein
LSLAPEEGDLLIVAGRAALAGGRVREARTLIDSAVAVRPDANALLALIEVQEAAGDSAGASDTRQHLERQLAGDTSGLHRRFVLWLLDHGADAAAIAQRAERDLATRPDVYGLDLYAWALFRGGRLPEAIAAERRALSWGTEDPLLVHHLRTMLAAER